MKWTYIIRQKTKAATVIAVVFGLILVTNRIDKNYFSQLQNSFASVYEDRLLAESYIYQLSGLLHHKKMLMDEWSQLNTERINATNKALDDSVKALVAIYEATQLTKTEARLFDELRQKLAQLQALESRYGDRDANYQQAMTVQHRKLSVNLDRLSEIQLAETKNIVDNSNRIIASSNLTSQLEIGIIIVMGLIIQALVFASKSTVPRFPQNSRVN